MALITKIKTIYSEVVAALGFTPENAANKGQPNGYAGLDAGGRVPAAQLPSYVDDVQEFSTLSAFPATGAAGIIYLALDTNIIYRWSGSTYIEIASGDVDWSNITNKPAFGTMSTQDANNVTIVGGTGNFTSIISGNLSLLGDEITTTQASGNIVITPTGVGAVSVGNRATINNLLSLGSSDNGGTYLGKNAEYIESGFLSAWRYLDTGAATRMDMDNGSGLTIANAPSGNAGDIITTWNEVFNITSAGDVVAGNWTAGIIGSGYGGTGVDNNGNTLTITANATISGTNTGDQTNITGNAGTATALQTARTINGVAFDGTANITITAENQPITLSGDVTGTGSTAITATLANTTVTAGTYGSATQIPQLTIDAKGRATAASNVTITPAWSSITDKPTTVAGYGITDAVSVSGAQTLTNKTVTDATFTIQDDLDNTKKAQFQASGISAATTRAYTLPDVNGTLVTTGDTGSVTNTMLAGSIADTKLNTIESAGKVSNSATTATSANTPSAIVARDANGDFTASQVTATKIGLGTITTPVNSLDTSGSILVNGEDTFIGIDAQTNPRLGMVKKPGFAPKMAYSASGEFIITQSDTDNINPLNVVTFNDRFRIDATGKVGINTGAVLGERLEIGGSVKANKYLADGAGNATTNAGQIFLNGTTSNRIDYNTNGLALPTFTTRSDGTKIVFRAGVSASAYDYGVGVAPNTLWFTVPATNSFYAYYTGANVAARLGNAGYSLQGVVYQGSSPITVLNVTSTLTIAQLLSMIIRSSPSINITFTLPTGTLTDAGVISSLEVSRSFTWSVVNIGNAPSTITIAGNTGMNYVGNPTIPADTSASFRTIKTAANTFITYRI